MSPTPQACSPLLHRKPRRPLWGQLAVAALCLTPFVLTPCYGQNSASTSKPAQSSKECDGVVPPQKSAHAGHSLSGQESSASDPSEAGSGASGLKLSIKKAASEDPAEAQGQFCKRERPNTGSLAPSAPSSQVDDNSQQRKADTPPPIAEVTNGRLTIQATGQDFTAVLDAVRLATGIAIDIPPGGSSEPVFMKLGPVSVRDALVALMDGASYNYLMLGSPTDPQTISRLVLSVRPAGNAPPLVASNAAAGGVVQPTLYGGQGYTADPDAATPEPPEPQQLQPTEIPSSVPTGINIQQLATQEGKTPGQILDELQKKQLEMLDQQNAAQAQQQPQ